MSYLTYDTITYTAYNIIPQTNVSYIHVITIVVEHE